MPHRHCAGAMAHAILRSRSPVSFQIHAPRRSKSAGRNSHPLPSSPRGPRSALCGQGPSRELPRRRLVERRHAAAGGCRPRRAIPRVHRPHRPLEGHFRRPQLGRVQARERHHLEPLRRGRLGPTAAHQRLAPDGRWFGDTPRVLVDVRGSAAAALIPKIKAAITAYGYSHFGDYRIWPGPNSNTFTATVLRAVPELETTLPSNAVGKDFRASPYVGLTDSGTGVEASLWGLLGIKLGWVEGVEVNFLGLVAGLDLRHPAVKLPGFGRIGVDDGTAIAAPARAK